MTGHTLEIVAQVSLVAETGVMGDFGLVIAAPARQNGVAEARDACELFQADAGNRTEAPEQLLLTDVEVGRQLAHRRVGLA